MDRGVHAGRGLARSRAVGVALAFLLWMAWAAASGVDLHAYWDSRCRHCHDDAGPFARSTLSVDNRGQLQGRHHRADLERFLHQHHLADDLVKPVTAMLAAQVTTPPLFKQHCAGCHVSAAEFARKSLVLRDNVLTGRASGRPVDDYLHSHGGLAPEQVPEMVKTLTRVLAEVGTR